MERVGSGTSQCVFQTNTLKLQVLQVNYNLSLANHQAVQASALV